MKCTVVKDKLNESVVPPVVSSELHYFSMIPQPIPHQSIVEPSQPIVEPSQPIVEPSQSIVEALIVPVIEDAVVVHSCMTNVGNPINAPSHALL